MIISDQISLSTVSIIVHNNIKNQEVQLDPSNNSQKINVKNYNYQQDIKVQ